MATIDQQFVEYIVKTLVNNPDKVVVERKIDEKGVLLTLTVDPDDVGRVIGKRGATAQAIRVLLRALGTKQDARYNLKIVNNDEDGHESSYEKRVRDDKESDVDESEEDSDKAAGNDEIEHDDENGEEYDENEDEDDVDEDNDDEDEDDEDEDDEDSSELAEKTRAELADLDDLDI